MNPTPTRTGRAIRRSTQVATLLFVAWASGCGGSFINPFAHRSGAAVKQLQLWVDNQNFNDLRIYAMTTRGPQALGQVGGRSTGKFTMEWRQLDELRFRFEFLAGRSYTSNTVNASPGDRLDLIIPTDPERAYLRRR